MHRDDPYAAFTFLLELEGVVVAGFSECSGLTSEADVMEYREGNEFTVARLPGLRKYSNISLTRGFTASTTIRDWRKNTLAGQTDRRSGSIVLLDEGREEAVRWNFHEGWPAKWEGPSFDARNNEVAIESLEIVVERIELAT